MAAARSKVPAIGSAQWILDERNQANELVSQELEDFGFSVRNEFEWLNEHMAEIFAQNGQNKLDVFKTPGKLRGKTPRTARKKAAEPRQPLGDLFGVNAQHRPSPAEQSLKGNLHKSPIKARFNIAEDSENVVPARTPAKSPAPPLFANLIGKGKENRDSHGYHSQHASPERRPATGHATVPVQFSPIASTQDTVASHVDDDIFSPPQTQSTQPTQATQSFAKSSQASEDERRDTGDSFVSAKEAFGSKNGSKENLHDKYDGDAMDLDDDRPDEAHSDAQDTVVRHNLSSDHDDMVVDEIPDFPQPPPRRISERYSISANTQAALDTADQHAYAPEPRNVMAPTEAFTALACAESEDVQHDDTVVHHEIDDQMEIDDDVRSPSDGSSPVKPLVRKSSLTFASLPAREPLLAKKSMGNRNSRTSHVDLNKARGSTLGRFTGGKSLGGSQLQQTEPQQETTDLDEEQPELQREELETTKLHNKTSSQRLLERINMLKQQNEAPKRISQNILASQMSQTASFASSQAKEPAQSSKTSQPPQSAQAPQPAYPNLPAVEPEQIEDEDDDWISPVRTVAPPPKSTRPPFSKSHSADTRPSPAKVVLPKPISVSNPDLPAVVESTTPVGSPTGKKYMDGPLSASKAKFYSALRAAKEKIIGSSATSAQVKLDALAESPMRPKLKVQESSEDVFTSPKRNEKNGASIFSHLRSPSKESVKSGKSKIATMPGSPVKDGRRTRSSSEREKQKEKDLREKQRVDDRLREMREKEQSKAAAHHQKSKAPTSKTPSAMSSQQSLRQAASAAAKTPVAAAQQPHSRPGPSRTNTATSNEPDSADEMPPPPPPKSLLPTTGQKLRQPRTIETKKLAKASSKETLPKAKPQKIMVSLHSSRYGQAPPTASKHAPPAPAPVATAPMAAKQAPTTQRMGPPATKPAQAAPTRPASALSSKSGASYKPVPAKPAPRVGRPPTQKAAEKPMEKPKPPPAQNRADLAAARPVGRMQTIQDANRIQVPPVNPAKPAKRPFQPEHDEPLQRPAKRPSQPMKMNPITPGPAHAQFAKGKIPFAEPTPSAQKPQPQYQNGEEIKLPEIMTDSEDEDSDNEFEQPSWVDTPNLRDLLTQQQLIDPEHVFGPIPPLNMEQVFPNKERHKRFRERTSSAYWANDQVTEEERRKDREAKERLFREGAWTYNPSPRPTPRPGL
ncbi:hypothetical protein N0V90_007208 [Kalmusia sp. IMI 367209]|nr:hypothetical protein N0V90_007208 [Kalmusia sp. IMI 367209]